MSPLDVWRLFFPKDELPHILRCTNEVLPDKKKEVTKGELMKVFGILYAMTTVTMPSKRSYWAVDNGLFPAPAFGERYGMGYHRFENILRSLSFEDIDDEAEEDDGLLQ